MQPETAAPALGEYVLEGALAHRHRMRVEHGFNYRMWMVMARLENSALPWSLKPRASRYMSAAQALDVAGLESGDAQVWVLTQPSLIGRSFNPVSFYFIQQQGRLRSIIAHITNTPWDEEHCYVLEYSGSNVWVFDKAFHISPFMPMGLRYEWRFQMEGDYLGIRMQSFERGMQVFSAALSLRPAKQSAWMPLKLRLKYPGQNLLTVIRIYWQAAILKLKGARFYAHPDNTPVLRARRR